MKKQMRLFIITALLFFVAFAFVQSSNACSNKEWSKGSCQVSCGQSHGTRTETCSTSTGADENCTLGATKTVDCSIDEHDVVACPTATPTPTCTPTPTPTPAPTHYACNTDHYCAIVQGAGESSCRINADCVQSPTPTPTPTPEVTPTPTPETPPSTNSGGPGDGKSDNLGCGSHDCSNHPSSQAVLGASTVLGLSTTSGEENFLPQLIQALAALTSAGLGFTFFKKNA